MAVGWSAAYANAMHDAAMRGVSFSGSSTHFIKLYVGEPGPAGLLNAATNTLRKTVTWTTSASGITTNSTLITWATGETTTEDYSHWGDFTALSGGTFVGCGVLNAAPNTAGFAFQIAIGALSISENVAT